MASDTQALIRVADLPDVRILLDELDARRAAMKHADDLGIDVAAVARLICPPICETCRGTGFIAGHDPRCDGTCKDCLGCPVQASCPDCHGRPKQTLHDRLAELHDLLCSIAGHIDPEYSWGRDMNTAIEWASALTDETQAVTP